MDVKRILTSAIMGIMVLAFGCAEKEPERGVIQKRTEKTAEGKVTLEQDYYVDRKGMVLPHGMTKRMYGDGKIMIEGEFKDGKRVGNWTEYYQDGKKKGVVGYKDGLPDGPFTAWYANGQIKAQGNNVRGLQDGEWIYYSEDGKELRREMWEEGEDITGKPGT